MRLRPPAIAALFTVPAVLAAQEPTPRDSAVALPMVSVTAARQPEPVLTVPLAVTQIPAAQLRVTRGIGLDEALRLVPGVIAQSRAGGTDVRLVIRGYGARGAGDRSNAGTSRGVRVLLDGIPETEPDGRTAFDQIDLGTAEAIEVVRSNASSVWGNAAGGVVSIRTVPAITARGVEVQPVYGSFGLRRQAVRAAAPLGTGVGYVNLAFTRFDGWRAHSGARRTVVNAGTLGVLGEATTLTVVASAADNLFRIPGPLTQAALDADPQQANAVYASRDERRHNRVVRLGATLDHAMDSLTRVSAMVFVNPKYLQRSERNTFRDFTRYHLGGNVIARHAWTLGGGSRLSLLAGADEAYQSGAILFYNLVNGERGDTLRDNKGEGANNFGVFTHAEWERGAVLVSAGARWDAIGYDYRSFIDPRLDDKKTFRGVSPKVGINWRFGELRSLYANVGGGVEAPAGNETDPAGTFGQDTVTAINPLLEPIRSTTFELGARQLAPRAGTVRLAYDVAAYTTGITNEIVPYRGGRFYFTAGRARRSGVEIGADVTTAAGPFVQGALALSRNRYVRYVVDSVHYGRPGQFADYSGNAVAGVPSRTATLVIGSDLAAATRPLRLSASAQHTGAYWLDDANTVQAPASTVLGARIATRDIVPVGALGVQGFISVENLAGTRYVASAFVNPDVVAGEPVAFEPGLPRTLVVSLTLGWR